MRVYGYSNPWAGPYGPYRGYGLIGTDEEIARIFEGIARWNLPPGTHVVRKPQMFCVPEAMAPDLIRAVEDHAHAMGWTVDDVQVAPCDRGSPPGVSVTFTITVGEASAPPPTNGERTGTILGTTLGQNPAKTVGGTGESTTIPPEEDKGIGTGWIIAGGVLALAAVAGGIYIATR